jgi:aldose 1-epimerase
MKPAEQTSRKRTTSARGTHFSTRGWVTPGIVALLCAGLLIASYERGHGNLHKLKTRVDPAPPPEVMQTGPGGQDAVRLSRSATTIGKDVELISATFLPGRGMNVFQITALIPGHGEVSLLASPSLPIANRLLSGQDEDANGSASTTMGGAILLPWAQHLFGTPMPNSDMLQTSWNGHQIKFPAAMPQSTMSVEGLLLNRGADGVKSDVLPDGQTLQAVFHTGNFSGDWPSTVDVTVDAQLTAHDLDLTVTAKNTGTEPMPFGTGWHPFFAIPSGDRTDALLRIPSQTVEEVDRRTGLPTGRMVAVNDSVRDFSRAAGTRIGVGNLNETYTKLQPDIDDGPIAEIRDPAYNVKLRIIPLTSNITSMRVISPVDKSWVSIGPNTNLDDPFGAEWSDPAAAGIITLAPGATFKWKVRLELSLIGTATAATP